MSQAFALLHQKSTAERQALLGLCALLFLIIVGLKPGGVTSIDVTLTGEGDPLRQVSYVGVFLFVMATQGAVRGISLMKAIPVTFVLLMSWCLISLVWAVAPSVALRRLALTIMILTSILVCIDRAGARSSLLALQYVLIVALILNYAAVALLPSGRHAAGEIDPALIGNWRGVLRHKNVAGPLCALTVLIFALSPRRVPTWISLPTIALSTVFLYMSMSKTSMALLAAALLIGFLYRFFAYRFRKTLILMTAASPLIVISIYFAYPQLVTDFLESPDTLTGRSQIWAIVMEYVGQNPVFGAGYGSFWNIGDASPVFAYTGGWVSGITSGHNGYIDMLAQIGWPGLTLLLVATLFVPLFAIYAKPSTERKYGSLLLSIIIFCLGHNITESSILNRDELVWVFLILGIAMVRQEWVFPERTQRSSFETAYRDANAGAAALR